MPIPTSKRTPTLPAGLSRLEVLVCLILIGVLLSMLLTRLADMSRAARPARLQAAMGQVRAAAAVFHARCQALRGSEATADCTRLAVDGQPVAGVNRGAAASAEGIARAAARPRPRRDRVDGFRLRSAPRGGVPALYIGLGEPACEFFYVQASRPDGVPEVDIVDASCH